MSVIFNYNDHNLTKIEREAKLFNFVTKDRYKVYGLADDGNPPIWFTTGTKVDTSKFTVLTKWLKNNGIDSKVDADEGKNKEVFVPRQVSIGMRRDLRTKVIYSACLIQTIVYYLEGKLALRGTYKVPGLPKPR